MKQSKAQARPKTNFIELRKSINSAIDAATLTDTDTSVAIAYLRLKPSPILYLETFIAKINPARSLIATINICTTNKRRQCEYNVSTRYSYSYSYSFSFSRRNSSRRCVWRINTNALIQLVEK